jgi:hypothetical protein
MLYFFKNDVNKNMFENNEYYNKSFSAFSNNESFFGSLTSVPLQIIFEEAAYGLQAVSSLINVVSEFLIGFTTHENPGQHFSQCGEHLLDSLAYLLMMVITPVLAVCRPFIRLCQNSVNINDNPPAYNQA